MLFGNRCEFRERLILFASVVIVCAENAVVISFIPEILLRVDHDLFRFVPAVLRIIEQGQLIAWLNPFWLQADFVEELLLCIRPSLLIFVDKCESLNRRDEFWIN